MKQFFRINCLLLLFNHTLHEMADYLTPRLLNSAMSDFT